MCQARTKGSSRNSYLRIMQGEKKKKIEQKNYLQVLCSALESLWGLPFTFYFILILGLKCCTHTLVMLLRMVYIRGEVSVVGPEQMKDLSMNDPIYGIVWSLVIRAILTQRKRLPLFFSVGRLKTKCYGLYDQDCSFMMLFLNCKAHQCGHLSLMCRNPKSIISHWNHCGTQGFLPLYLG